MKKALLTCGLIFMMLFCSFGVMAANQDTETRYVVTFKDGNVPSSAEARLSAADQEGLCTNGEESWLVVDQDAADALANDPNVESIEETGLSYLSYVPNDPYVGNQYALSLMNISSAWDYGYRGKSDLNIVVIDSGFLSSHPDKGLVKSGYDYVPNKRKDLSHGTFCAGLIGAGFNNGIGIAGALQYGNVYMLRCFYYDSTVNNTVCDNYTIAQAIRGAVDVYHADVISMSFGSLINDSSLRDAINYARSKGVILIAATGNRGAEGSPLEYPAAYPGVIGVGSVNSNANISLFSTKNSSVDVVAAGENVISLGATNEYVQGSGTSFATPYVAALAGMALSYDPNMTPAEFEQFLKKTSKDLGAKGYDTAYGYGLINYNAFMSDVINGYFCDVPNGCWYESSVYAMADLGVIKGDSHYYFKPNNTTTRAEFVTMLCRLSGDNENNYDYAPKFSDVKSNSWFRKYVNWAQAKGVVNGTSPSTFSPNQKINRAEMATMMARYVDTYGITLPQEASTNFADAGSIPGWARSSVDRMSKAGLIKGFENNTFRPKENALRCQAVTILDRLHQIGG